MTDNIGENKIFSIDVTPVYIGEKEVIDFSYELDSESVKPDDDVEFTTPVIAKGFIKQTASGTTSSEGYVELVISVETTIKAPCARCLEDVESKFEAKAVYSVTPFLQNAEENETCLMTSNGILDVEEVARTLFLLNLPSKYLCKHDCKGICPDCGVNLNTDECKCTQKEVDPRLSALKNFFKG